MPRYARKDILSNFIHLMIQGINKEYIFKDDIEIKVYLKYLKEKIQDTNLKIVSYCMMNNHAHFLINCKEIEEVSKLMSRVNTKYAKFYNNKNNRCGIVFRNRFKSEEILTNSHLITCIKYIHNNPVKAGMCRNAEEYKYSSYNEYKNNKAILLDLEFIQEFTRKFEIKIEDILNNEMDKYKFIEYDEKNYKENLKENIVNEFMKNNQMDDINEFKENKKYLKSIVNIMYFDYQFTQVDISNALCINRLKIYRILKEL